MSELLVCGLLWAADSETSHVLSHRSLSSDSHLLQELLSPRANSPPSQK